MPNCTCRLSRKLIPVFQQKTTGLQGEQVRFEHSIYWGTPFPKDFAKHFIDLASYVNFDAVQYKYETVSMVQVQLSR